MITFKKVTSFYYNNDKYITSIIFYNETFINRQSLQQTHLSIEDTKLRTEHLSSYNTCLLYYSAFYNIFSFVFQAGRTAAHCAAKEGHVDVLKLLIEVGQADISVTDKVRHIIVTNELFTLKYDI